MTGHNESQTVIGVRGVDHRRHSYVGSHDLNELLHKTTVLIAEYHKAGEYEAEELVPRTGLYIRFDDWTELLVWDTGHGLQIEIGEDMTGIRESQGGASYG